jgi:lipopolysaccharide export system protein LptA
MTRALRTLFDGLALALVLGATVSHAAGQPGGSTNAVQGFSQHRNQPVKIEAASLEVREKDKVATFLGDVNLTQGDTTLRCKTLVVYYETSGPGAAAVGGDQQRIRRVEAKGNVVVTQKEQTATGDAGTFDMRANTVTLSGNVVVAQGQNVLRGERLVVDLTTGVSRVEAGKVGPGRVQGLFLPGSGSEASKPGPARPARPN